MKKLFTLPFIFLAGCTDHTPRDENISDEALSSAFYVPNELNLSGPEYSVSIGAGECSVSPTLEEWKQGKRTWQMDCNSGFTGSATFSIEGNSVVWTHDVAGRDSNGLPSASRGTGKVPLSSRSS